MTRQQILTALNGLDTATLEKLLEFQDKLIIPDADCLVKVTFNDMIDKAHDLADVYFPQWTDRTKADFGEFLVELMALNSFKNYWYINNNSLEAFLQSAKTYANVYYHALRVGYTPTGITSSSFLATLTFNGVPAPFAVSPGGIEVSYGNSDLVFTNTGTINVAAGGPTVIPNCAFKSGRVTNSNSKFNGRAIKFPAANVDPSSIALSIDGQPWSRVLSFADSANNSKHYMVQPTDGNEVEIIFGQNGYGLRPPLDAICNTSYRVDKGGDVNKAIGALVIVRNVANNYLTTAVMGTAATGGSRAENIESIRQNASMLYRTYNTGSIRGSEDAIRILEAMPDIYGANAFVFSNQLYFAVIPQDGSHADNTFMNTVADRIRDDVMMGFDLAASLTSYINIASIEVTAYIYNEFDVADVIQQIKDYFTFITSPLAGAGYGVGLDIGQAALELTSNIAGLSNIVFENINGAPAENIVLSQLQIFDEIDQADITVNYSRVS